MTPRKRESARERDERIVAKAGSWGSYQLEAENVWPSNLPDDDEDHIGRYDTAHQRACDAAVRILNRIAKGKRDD